ncbi:hypothetical protein MTP99_017439 [Tenebrio molitor]|nr:hypothetical protein MTP99_017439 [Tenebrio molitor]
MDLTKTLLLLLSLYYLDRPVFAALSYFVSPDDLVHQIVPLGAPWPANQAGYFNFTQIAEVTPPAVNIVPVRFEITTTTTERPVPVQFVDTANVAISLPDYITRRVPSMRPDFHRNPWAGFSSTESYWTQNLPFE